MDGLTAGQIGKLVGEGGIYGLGWILFIFMMFREVRERKRYSDLVVHIIQYFTKIRMVEHEDSSINLPAELFGAKPTNRGVKRTSRSQARDESDEE